MRAVGNFFSESNVKVSRKMRLIPISAGTTATDCAANCVPLSKAMKRKAMMMVDGSVPSTPPVFVPYFSAITVIKTTTKADITNGRIVW